MNISRRHFLAASAATVAAPVYSVRWAKAAAPTKRALVVVFLRGGIDAMNFLAPAGDKFYEQSRPAPLRVSLTGEKKGLLLGNMKGAGDMLLHPDASALMPLWKKGTLTMLPATGLNNPTRSHFQAMDLIERGIIAADSSSPRDGWLTRAAAAMGEQHPGNVLAIGGALPQSLSLCEDALEVADVWDISWLPSKSFGEALHSLHAGDSMLDRASRQALQATDSLAAKLTRNDKDEPIIKDPPKGIAYPDNDFGQQLKFLANLLQQNPDVHVATADLDGWDTHENQPDRFSYLTKTLTEGLAALTNHLDAIGRETTIVVMSEFGRRIKANESRGTDHGHGGLAMVIDPALKGGTLRGEWPGLAPEQLDQGMDLAITTDFRDVLSSVLSHHGAEGAIAAAFPGHQPKFINGLFRT
jgi:uncharacterized protein (DUF1501 family)